MVLHTGTSWAARCLCAALKYRGLEPEHIHPVLVLLLVLLLVLVLVERMVSLPIMCMYMYTTYHLLLNHNLCVNYLLLSHIDAPSRVTDLGDSMGGDCRSSFLFALSVPVVWPLRNKHHQSQADPSNGFPGLRAFAFVNAGSLGNSSYWTLSSLALANSKIPRKTAAAADNGVPVQSTTVSTITTSTTTTTTTSSNAAVVSPTTAAPSWSSYQGKSIPFLGYLRASVGVGMSLSLSNAVRLEASYSL